MVVAATLLAGVVVIGIAATQTAWFRNWLRGYITREAHQYLNGELSIGRLGGNLFFGIELEDAALTLNGRPVVSVKDLELRYNALEFLSKGLSIRSIRIGHPVVYLQRDERGWTIARLVKETKAEANRSGPDRPMTIDEIGVSAGSLVFEQPFEAPGVVVPTRFDGIDAQFAFKYEPVRYSIAITHFSLRGVNPDVVVAELSGGVSVHGDEINVQKLALRTGESSLTLDGAIRNYLSNPWFTVQAVGDPVSLPELGRIVPSLAGIGLRPAIRLSADGPLDQLTATLDVRSSAGDLSGQIVADLAAPDQAVRGTMTVRHFDLAPLSGRAADKSDVSGVLKADVRAASFADIESLRGTVDIDASASAAAGYAVDRVKARARVDGRRVGLDGSTRAYGATATFDGRVEVPRQQPVSYDLRGEFRSVNLARLPKQLKLPAARTNVNGSYHASGAGSARVRGDVRLAESDVPGAHLVHGSTIAVSMRSGGRSAPQLDYTADVTAERVDLQEVGRAFAVKALEGDRYRTLLNVHAQANGRGTSPASMEATLRGELTDSTLFAGRVPQLVFDAQLDHDDLRVKAAGTIADLDPGRASGRPQLTGMVAAAVDVDATIAHLSAGVDLNAVDATARVSLLPSELNGLRFDRGCLDASYHAQTIDVRTLDVSGPDVMLRATGTVSLAPESASALTVHADLLDLAEVGKLAKQELTGMATVDAAVTGNRTNLVVKGTLKGSGLSSGNNGALTLSTDYTAEVPNFSAPDAIVSAATHATFATIGGQHVDQLTATTRYEQSRLEIDVNARQATRSMSAAGSVLLAPDDRELRLTRLDLAEQNLQWHLAPGSEAAIRYDSGVTTVKGLRLVSGDQEITAGGTFGKSGAGAEPLNITVKNLDLSAVDALLLRPPQFSGRLNASGTVSGSVDAPRAEGEFAVNQGGFRGFRYEAFKGSAAYDGAGVTLDTELQQNPAASLRATGFVPATAFKAPEEAAEASSKTGEFDLRIESTPIDLGIVQGLTTAFTNVTGTVQATIRVTGPGTDPRPNGEIRFTGGAFTVNATGVPYTGLDGRIELQDDHVHIASLGVTDNARSPLSLTGDVPIRRALTGDVKLQITARDFKVLDNKMGKVRIKSDLRVAGELRAPRIEGDLALSTGTINLDPILASAGDGAYATKPVEYLPASRPAPDPDAAGVEQTAGVAGVAVNVTSPSRTISSSRAATYARGRRRSASVP